MPTNWPCASPPVDCPNFDNSPLINNSSELPDPFTFFADAYGPNIPPYLGWKWSNPVGYAPCYSPVSEADAEACATGIVNTIPGGWVPPDMQPNPPGRTFKNQPVSASASCPDGSIYVFEVAEGMFSASSVAAANEAALDWGMQQAELHLLCLSALPSIVCVGQEIDLPITPSSAFVAPPGSNIWDIEGDLPDGTGFVPASSGPASIIGTPQTPGLFSFEVFITVPNDDHTSRLYTLTVAGITNATLPDATIGTPYSATLETIGFTAPLFSLESGSLPPGLTLNQAGTISGTPTGTAAGYSFVVNVKDGLTGFQCNQTVTLTVNSGVCAFGGANIATIDPVDTIEQFPQFTVYAPNVGLVFGGAASFDLGANLWLLDIFNPTNGAHTSMLMNTPSGPIPQTGIYYPPNGMIYLFSVTAGADEVEFVNPHTQTVTGFATDATGGGQPTGMAIDVVRGRIYLCAQASLQYLDVATSILHVIDTSPNQEGGMDYAPSQNLIACNLFNGSVSLYDATSLTQVGSFASPNEASVTYCPDDNCLYVGGLNSTGTDIYQLGAALSTTVNFNFTVPAVNNTVAILVVDSTGMLIGNPITIGGKNYSITAVTNMTHITVKNLNDTPGNTVTVGTLITTTGFKHLVNLGEGAFTNVQYSPMHKKVLHTQFDGANGTNVSFIDPLTHTFGAVYNYPTQIINLSNCYYVATAPNCTSYFSGTDNNLGQPFNYFLKH